MKEDVTNTTSGKKNEHNNGKIPFCNCFVMTSWPRPASSFSCQMTFWEAGSQPGEAEMTPRFCHTLATSFMTLVLPRKGQSLSPKHCVEGTGWFQGQRDGKCLDFHEALATCSSSLLFLTEGDQVVVRD